MEPLFEAETPDVAQLAPLQAEQTERLRPEDLAALLGDQVDHAIGVSRRRQLLSHLRGDLHPLRTDRRQGLETSQARRGGLEERRALDGDRGMSAERAEEVDLQRRERREAARSGGTARRGAASPRASRTPANEAEPLVTDPAGVHEAGVLRQRRHDHGLRAPHDRAQEPLAERQRPPELDAGRDPAARRSPRPAGAPARPRWRSTRGPARRRPASPPPGPRARGPRAGSLPRRRPRPAR